MAARAVGPVRQMMAPMPDYIQGVLATGIPAEILYPIVRWVTISVQAFLPVWALANERFQN